MYIHSIFCMARALMILNIECVLWLQQCKPCVYICKGQCICTTVTCVVNNFVGTCYIGDQLAFHNTVMMPVTLVYVESYTVPAS